MSSTIAERFKPAGHKAQELSDAVLPDEVFKPIQRVIDTTLEGKDKTIGYLYHDVEYMPGVVGSVVLSKGLLRNADGEIKKNVGGWQEYNWSETANPFGWFVPSAPVVLELCYQTQQDNTKVSREAQQSWHETLNPKTWWIQTSTLLKYNKGHARVYHNWTIHSGTTPALEENGIDISDDNPPVVNAFIHTTLGRRYSSTKKTFEKYGRTVALWTPVDSRTSTRALVLGSLNDWFLIGADNNIDTRGPACGGAVAKKLLEGKRYEVRDA